MDSKVIAGRIEKECIARDSTLEKYLALVRRMEITLEDSQSSTETEIRTPKPMNW
jgi:hypothetical protein